MKIEITWVNYNGGTEDNVFVYRDDKPIADTPTIPPIATLPPGSTSYADETVVRGKLYYYRVAISKGGETRIDADRCILAILPEDTGPGPKTITIGDWHVGYFGVVKSADLLSYADTMTLIDPENIVGGSTAYTQDTGWVKIAYKGKVLFIPRSFFRDSITYRNIYNAGLVYGTPDTGLSVPTGSVPKNQYKVVNIKGSSFIPRTLQGHADSVTGQPPTSSNNSLLTSEPEDCEWDVIARAINPSMNHVLSVSTPLNRSIANIAQEFGPYITTQRSTSDICQQPKNWANKATFPLRGGRYVGSTPGVWYSGTALAFDTGIVSASVSAFAGAATSTNLHITWRPVLELVIY